MAVAGDDRAGGGVEEMEMEEMLGRRCLGRGRMGGVGERADPFFNKGAGVAWLEEGGRCHYPLPQH